MMRLSRLERNQQRKKRRLILTLFGITVILSSIFSTTSKNKFFQKKEEVKGSCAVGVYPTLSPPKVEKKESPKIVQVVKAVEKVEEEDEFKKIDSYVADSINEFFFDPKYPERKSEVRMIMHCLLYRESMHNLNKNKGDNGKAEGLLQYHEGTWIGFRKIMINRGLATEIGSKYDLKEAIRTTVWAISDGRATNWGPILRWTEKRYSEATCPSPSFSKIIN